MDNQYVTVAGIIQFDPRHRDVKGKTVRDIAIRSIGNQKLVNVTVWPEKASITLNKGDFVVVDGKLTQSMGQNKNGETQTYYNLSANTVIRVSGEQPADSSSGSVGVSMGIEEDDFTF